MFRDAIIEPQDPRWMETLRRFPKHDFYHYPAYVELEAERRGAQARAYICADERAAFLVPFVQAAVPLTMQPGGEALSDVLAPYGYASPLVIADGDEELRAHFLTLALARFTEHLRQRNVCSVLLRFHPLLPLPLEPFRALGTLVKHGETVWVNLRQTPEELWTQTRGRFRTYIRGLQRDGYTVEFDPAGRRLEDFMKLYYDSMRRVGAMPEYYFSREYFLTLKGLLGGGFLLAHVRAPSGGIVSSGMFTICSGVVQYHLSGNDIGEEGANGLKLLLHEVRNWAREQGYESLHLGGGVGAQNDPLFQFKSGFSPERAPFYTWRCVVNEAKYMEFCAQWEAINRLPADGLEGYFPAYRKLLPPAEASAARRCA